MKKEFLNEETVYVAPSMKVVEMQMECAVLESSIAGSGPTDNTEWQ